MSLLSPVAVASGLAGLRIANGCVLVFRPAWAERLYLGPGGRSPTARVLARFTGVRDIASGVGALVAVNARRGDAEIVGAAAGCEAADAVFALCSRGVDGRLRLASVTSVGAALLGVWAARGLAEERREPSATT